MRPLILSALLTLTACGFEPMAAQHSSPSSTNKQLAAIEVAPVEGRSGQIFRSKLEDLLNPGGAVSVPKQYLFTSYFTTSSTPALTSPDGSIQRYNLLVNSDYTLTRIKDGKVIQKGQLKRTGAYNNLSTAYFSTYVSQQDTELRIYQSMAEEYRLRLASILEDADKDSAAHP